MGGAAESLSWSSPERSHLTLRFFGELPTPTLELVAELQVHLEACPPLSLTIGRPGTFGGRDPQVAWLGVGGAGVPELLDLGATLARAPGLGPQDRRPFRPHLTLARLRRRRRIERQLLERALNGLSVAPLSFEVREVVLFSSNAGTSGPLRHEVLARLPLRAPEAASRAIPPEPLGTPGRFELQRHLAIYLTGAAAKPPPSRAARLALAAAARAALGHALPWPPAPHEVAPLLIKYAPAAQARARRRLAERARIEERRVQLGLQDARRRLDDLLEESEEDPAGGAESAAREAEAWVARHGLPREWFEEEATRVGLELGLGATSPTGDPRAKVAREPAAPEDAPYRAALEAVWREDAVYLGQRESESQSSADLEVALTRAPRPGELAHLQELLSAALEREVRVLGARSLGGGRRRLRLDWGQAPRPSPDSSAAGRPARTNLGPERAKLLERLAEREPERSARRDFLLGVSPLGQPVFLRQLLDRRGRADLACWAGPWEGRTQVALVLGERALERGLSAGVLLRRTLQELGGAGGGSPRWAEGSCPEEPEAVLRALRRWVEAGGLS